MSRSPAASAGRASSRGEAVPVRVSTGTAATRPGRRERHQDEPGRAGEVADRVLARLADLRRDLVDRFGALEPERRVGEVGPEQAEPDEPDQGPGDRLEDQAGIGRQLGQVQPDRDHRGTGQDAAELGGFHPAQRREHLRVDRADQDEVEIALADVAVHLGQVRPDEAVHQTGRDAEDADQDDGQRSGPGGAAGVGDDEDRYDAEHEVADRRERVDRRLAAELQVPADRLLEAGPEQPGRHAPAPW